MSTPGLPFPTKVALASVSDGLRRWLRLTVLWRDAVPEHTGLELVQLARQLETALDDAAAHAEDLAGFYEGHANAVNALVAAVLQEEQAYEGRRRAKEQFSLLGEDPAGALATRARRFVEGVEGEREFLRVQVATAEQDQVPRAARVGDVFCDAVWDLMMEAYVSCFDGDEDECDTEWGDIYEEYGC